jgi:hypothetical protein
VVRSRGLLILVLFCVGNDGIRLHVRSGERASDEMIMSDVETEGQRDTGRIRLMRERSAST